MKSLGLIVEYNPFHNGHLHHLKQSTEQADAQVIIAVMSGHFTQRGEPTIINKWERAQMALENGADLIVELPYAYSCQHAELFAKGAVSILTHLQTNALIFGSESGNISDLVELENLTSSEIFQHHLQNHLKTGLSLPKAQAQALKSYNVGGTLATAPNNTLGLYYLRAIRELNSSITPGTIPRLHSHYHDQQPIHHEIASATSIRLLREQRDFYTPYVPANVHTILNRHLETTQTIHTWESYFSHLKHQILTLTPTRLAHIHDITEGLEHRLYSAALISNNFAQFMDRVLTKRYTRTRIQRICTHILTATTKEQIATFNLKNGAPYIRILGMSSTGRRYLKSIKKEVTIPIYSKFEALGHPMLKHEQAVTAAYSSILPEPHCTNLNKAEYTAKPIMKEMIPC